MVEFGFYSEDGKMKPIGKQSYYGFEFQKKHKICLDLIRNKSVTDLGEWKHRQGAARDALMEEGKREVANALELISRQGLTTMIMIAMILMIFVSIVFMIIINREELIGVGEEKGDKNRRAAVFYFDKVDFSVKSSGK